MVHWLVLPRYCTKLLSVTCHWRGSNIALLASGSVPAHPDGGVHVRMMAVGDEVTCLKKDTSTKHVGQSRPQPMCHKQRTIIAECKQQFFSTSLQVPKHLRLHHRCHHHLRRRHHHHSFVISSPQIFRGALMQVLSTSSHYGMWNS